MANMLLAKNFAADVALPPFRLVKPGSADGRMALATAATDLIIGVNMELAAAAGERIDVQLIGIACVEAGAAIPRGSLITADATGRAIVAAPAAGANVSVAGRTLEAATAAGDVINFLQAPGQAQG